MSEEKDFWWTPSSYADHMQKVLDQVREFPEDSILVQAIGGHFAVHHRGYCIGYVDPVYAIFVKSKSPVRLR